MSLTELQEGNVFTGVCLSMGGQGISGPMSLLPGSWSMSFLMVRYLWSYVPSGGWIYPTPWILCPRDNYPPGHPTALQYPTYSTRNHKSSWYASYWNAFLFDVIKLHFKVTEFIGPVPF